MIVGHVQDRIAWSSSAPCFIVEKEAAGFRIRPSAKGPVFKNVKPDRIGPVLAKMAGSNYPFCVFEGDRKGILRENITAHDVQKAILGRIEKDAQDAAANAAGERENRHPAILDDGGLAAYLRAKKKVSQR